MRPWQSYDRSDWISFEKGGECQMRSKDRLVMPATNMTYEIEFALDSVFSLLGLARYRINILNKSINYNSKWLVDLDW